MPMAPARCSAIFCFAWRIVSLRLIRFLLKLKTKHCQTESFDRPFLKGRGVLEDPSDLQQSPESPSADGEIPWREKRFFSFWFFFSLQERREKEQRCFGIQNFIIISSRPHRKNAAEPLQRSCRSKNSFLRELPSDGSRHAVLLPLPHRPPFSDLPHTSFPVRRWRNSW